MTLPTIMIMFDRELAVTRPDESFYVRIDHDGTIEHVTLPCHTLPGARRIAEEQGYVATHWAQSPDWVPLAF